MRYVLRDLARCEKVMAHPGRGAPFSVRTLAEASGVSRSQVGRLVSGELPDLPVHEVHRISEALGVAVLVLFMPPSSPN